MFLYFVTQVVVKKFLKRAINLLHLLSFYFVISFLPRIFETPPFTLQRSRDNGWTILDYITTNNTFWSLTLVFRTIKICKVSTISFQFWIFMSKIKKTRLKSLSIQKREIGLNLLNMFLYKKLNLYPTWHF